MEERTFSDISFRQYLNEDKLMGSRCKKCGALYTPPRSLCIKCYGSEMEWVKMKGTGRLAAFTCITVGPKLMIDEGFNRTNPYCVGVVELDEGTRVDARIEGVDARNPETIKVGMPLHVDYLHREEGANLTTFLAFKPV